jgi:hypothetical protein
VSCPGTSGSLTRGNSCRQEGVSDLLEGAKPILRDDYPLRVYTEKYISLNM